MVRCVYLQIRVRVQFNFLFSQEKRSLNSFLQLTVTFCRLHGTRPTMHIKMVTLTGVVQSIRGWRKARRKPRTPRPIPSSRSREKLRQKHSKYSFRVEVCIYLQVCSSWVSNVIIIVLAFNYIYPLVGCHTCHFLAFSKRTLH